MKQKKLCPYCKELIPATVDTCPFCKESLTSRLKSSLSAERPIQRLMRGFSLLLKKVAHSVKVNLRFLIIFLFIVYAFIYIFVRPSIIKRMCVERVYGDNPLEHSTKSLESYYERYKVCLREGGL